MILTYLNIFEGTMLMLVTDKSLWEALQNNILFSFSSFFKELLSTVIINDLKV